jgi:hypothetical protein
VAVASAEQIRQHLCYELKWMVRAVVRFEQVASEARTVEAHGEQPTDSDVVALQDSALLHARNLIEFAKTSSDPDEANVQWALSDILGAHRRKVPTGLNDFLDNWVLQVGDLRETEAKWPKDVDGNRIQSDDDQRLSKVVEVGFKMLKPKHRTTTLETDAGAAYVELLDRAREYFEQRTPASFDRLTCDGLPMAASVPSDG